MNEQAEPPMMAMEKVLGANCPNQSNGRALLTHPNRRLVKEGDLCIMVALHTHHASNRGLLHKLLSPAKESHGSSRDGHLYLCW